MTGDVYFYGRAETELKLAQDARDPAVIRAHYELANRYLDRFYNPDGHDAGQPTLAGRQVPQECKRPSFAKERIE